MKIRTVRLESILNTHNVNLVGSNFTSSVYSIYLYPLRFSSYGGVGSDHSSSVMYYLYTPEIRLIAALP